MLVSAVLMGLVFLLHALTCSITSPFAIRRVDPPLEGWCQTVPSEGNPRLILRLGPLIRSGLQAQAMSRAFFSQRVGKVRAGRVREAVR